MPQIRGLGHVGLYCRNLETMRDFYARVLGPEDNRIELYYTTPYDVRQPLGEPIDLDAPDADLLAFSKSLGEKKGPRRGAQRPVS